MSIVSDWVLTIVGLIVLTVIVELIMPEGSISKYIKGILVVFVIFVMVQPLTNINVESIFNDVKNEMSLDYEFISDVKSKKTEEYKKIIIAKLEDKGFYNVDLIVQLDSGEEYKIKSIIVDLYNLVLKTDIKNIDINSNVKAIIKDVVKIDEEDIILNV